jgi:hypothetical protein
MNSEITKQDWLAELKKRDGTTRQKYAAKFVEFCTTYVWLDEDIHDNFVNDTFIVEPALWNREAYEIAKSLLSQPPKFVDLVCKTIKVRNPSLFENDRPVRIMGYNKTLFRPDTFTFILENYPTLFQETEILDQIIPDQGLPAFKLFLEKNQDKERTLALILRVVRSDNSSLIREALGLGKLFTDYLDLMMAGYRNVSYGKIPLKSIMMLKCFVELYPRFVKQISIVDTYKNCETSKEVLQVLVEAGLLTPKTKEPNAHVYEYSEPDEYGDYCDIPFHRPTSVINLIRDNTGVVYRNSSEKVLANYKETLAYLDSVFS